MDSFWLQNFGSYPREALKTLLFMVRRWPKEKMFSVDDIGPVVGVRGRALSGALSAFSKRRTDPLVVKAGTTNVDDKQGREYLRPKQLWALNPRLAAKEVQALEKALGELLALEGWCGWCGYITTRDWEGMMIVKDIYGLRCERCGSLLMTERPMQVKRGSKS